MTTTNKLGELLKKSLVEVQQLRAALRRAEERESAPIAIVGCGLRAPGGVDGPDAYWELLKQGRDAVAPLPERWCPEAIYDPNPDAPGKSYVRGAGTLEDVERFDAAFFRITPKEALAMDPQQRLALECCWEALEHAGMRPEDLHGSLTGVYFGAMRSDYAAADADLASLDGYRATGVGNGVLAGRVSYTLGLEGPALAVDTACSSALVALHLACEGLRRGECDLALAGGVTVMSTPRLLVELSRLGASSPDGRCKAFSEEADGAGWAEGCGAVALKRLGDAERDGDRILALVRGSAVNQDGRSQGLTVPNGPSQSRLVQAALARSGLGPRDIDAIEAHGTGTRLGDPIEASALAAVFGGERSESPVWLGSSKSNFGHAQAAAGVLGLIKIVLALGNEELPKTLHAERPSRDVDWERAGLALLQKARPWPQRPERKRRAGVSAFGIGGTNAHVIVEEAPARREPPALAPVAGFPLLLSARDDSALRAQAARWASWLERHPDAPWEAVVRTAALRRTHFAQRAALRVSNALEGAEALRGLASGEPDVRVRTGRAPCRKAPVFVFSGQGGQWSGMGRSLLEESPEAADVIRACDAALRPFTGWSVEVALRGEPPQRGLDLDAIDVVQPCLFSLGLGLAAAWRALGLEPAAVVGHSLGEVTAAVIAGALSLEDGARTISLRSRLLARLAGTGAMLSVELGEQEVTDLLADARWAGLSISVVNGRSNTVVAGNGHHLEDFVRALELRGIQSRRVAVGCAAHSPAVDSILPELRAGLADVRARSATLPFVSSVSGTLVAGESLNGEYWCHNARRPVRLDRALAALRELGHDTFVEIGPHPVLSSPLHEMCGSEAAVAGSLRRDSGSLDELRAGLGELFAQGVPVDWAVRLGRGGDPVDLPTYAFQRTRHWLANPGASSSPDAGCASGRPVDPTDTHASAPQWRDLSPAERREHVEGLVVGAIRSAAGLGRDASLELSTRPLDLGLDSAMALALSQRIAARSGVALRPSDVLSAGSIAEVVERAQANLAGLDAASDTPPIELAHAQPGRWLVPLRRTPGARTRLVCFAYGGGGPAAFHTWPAGLPADVDVWAVELPGRGPRHREAIATEVAEVVEAVRHALGELPRLPLMVFGHSLGAILAFELVRTLETHGERVAHLFVSGAVAPAFFGVPDPSGLSDGELLDTLAELGLGQQTAMGADPDLTALGLRLVRADLALAARYRPAEDAPPLATAVTALSAGSDPVAPFEGVDAWRIHTQRPERFHHHHGSGRHDFIHTDRDAVLAVLADEVHAERARESRVVRPLSASGGNPRPQVVLLGGAGQGPPDYATLLDRLRDKGVGAQLHAIPGTPPRREEAPLRRMDDLASLLETELSALTMPIALWGHGILAHAAWEVVRRRTARGLPVALLAVSGAAAPQYLRAGRPRGPRAFPRALRDRAAGDAAVATALEANASLAAHYRPAASVVCPLAVPLTSIVARGDERVAPRFAEGWSALTGTRYTRIELEGGHLAPLEQPEALANVLAQAVFGATRPPPPGRRAPSIEPSGEWA